MQLESKTHISPLLAIESQVAQWLEHPTRSRRVVGSNPIWGSDFFRVPSGFYQHLISHVYISFSHSITIIRIRIRTIIVTDNHLRNSTAIRDLNKIEPKAYYGASGSRYTVTV